MKLAQKNKRREDEKKEEPDALDFTLEEDKPLKYFYDMYKNHVYD